MVIQTSQPIRIRGIHEGLLITLNEGPYEDLLQQLDAELAQKEAFLQGSKVALSVGRRPLRRDQLIELQDLLARHRLVLWTVLAEKEVTKTVARDMGLAIRLPGTPTDLDGNRLEPDVSRSPQPEETAVVPPIYVKETLRSGRSLYHEGAVIIMGDVNPGAEIIAGGDVIVWGRLRGLVHAGALGDETAVICALALTPTQLRIADQIAIPPNERQQQPAPEQALIQDGQIVAEPWPYRN